ncbi:MAG: hypothetical protein LUG54_02235 [Clostridiales bacterium]|nr:hypothetical protein [Clostridiales bacterium]
MTWESQKAIYRDTEQTRRHGLTAMKRIRDNDTPVRPCMWGQPGENHGEVRRL